jgi:hypothetical protein
MCRGISTRDLRDSSTRDLTERAAGMLSAMKPGAVLFTVLALGATACTDASARSCIRVPQSIPNSRLVTGHKKLTVPVGAIVYDVQVEAAEYAGPGFPWLTPTSSDHAVLAPVRLCKSNGVSSLPVEVTAFRAKRRGIATLTALLAPPWRSIKRKPQPSSDRVTVR